MAPLPDVAPMALTTAVPPEAMCPRAQVDGALARKLTAGGHPAAVAGKAVPSQRLVVSAMLVGEGGPGAISPNDSCTTVSG